MSLILRNPGDSLPNNCPICGCTLVWKGADLVCNNFDCTLKNFRDLECFVGFLGQIENLGNTWKIRFLDEFNINTVDDIFSTDFGSALSSDNKHKKLFYEMIDKIKNKPINVIDALCALNIPRLGYSTASIIEQSSYMRSGQFISDIKSHSIDYTKLSEITGLATTNSIRNNESKLDRLLYLSDRFKYTENISNAEQIKKVAVTGAVSVKRSVFEAELKEHGFILSAISKDTICLITEDPNGTSSKNLTATKLGIPKMTEANFRKEYMS